MYDKTLAGIQQTRISILIDRRFGNERFDRRKTDIHSDDPDGFIFYVYRDNIRNHRHSNVLILIRIHPSRLLIFHRDIIPSHMLEIIFIKTAEIRRFYTLKFFLCRIPRKKQTGCRLCELRIIAHICGKRSARILRKASEHILNVSCILLHIRPIGFKGCKISKPADTNFRQRIHGLLDIR